MSQPNPRIVDADGHVLEHPTRMVDFIESKYRDRCWRIETEADGSEWLAFDGTRRPANGMALAGAGGMTLEERERAVVELCYAADAATEREVAACLGVSKSWVNVLRQRALLALRNCLIAKGVRS